MREEAKPAGEMRRTAAFAAAAAALAGLAWLTQPQREEPPLFQDQGERFFPGFRDPLSAASLEIVTYDEAQAVATPFQVRSKGGRWTLPSHHDYPADARDRLQKTAADAIDLAKERVVSERVEDHEALGVIDPLDAAASLKGRGTRITFRDGKGAVLAGLILGREVPGQKGLRYARVPGSRRTYATKAAGEFPARFSDWIETDLLLLDPSAVSAIVIDSYVVDEERGTLRDRQQTALKRGEGDAWTLDGLKSREALDEGKVRGLVGALHELMIVDVRPKPAGLSRDLRRTDAEAALSLTEADLASLQSRGFYLTRDGTLVSNQGELGISCDDGVVYTLRFGEVTAGENRFLFVTASFVESAAPKPADDPADTLAERLKRWEAKVADGRKRAQRLADRFAPWYYVIKDETYRKVRLTRADLVKPKP